MGRYENVAGSNCGLHDEFGVLSQGTKGICSGLIHDVPSHGGAYRSSTTVPARQESISSLNADTENLKYATTVTANAMPDGKDTTDNSLCENADSEITVHTVVADRSSNATPDVDHNDCLLYTSPSPRDLSTSRMPSSA